MIILAAGLAYYPLSCPFGAIAWFQDCIMVRIRRSAVGSPGDQVPDLPFCEPALRPHHQKKNEPVAKTRSRAKAGSFPHLINYCP